MRDAGADQYTFHIEASKEPLALCRKIQESGMKVGIGIKPNTPVETVDDLVSEADMILIMTVEPGFGGQKFMTNMMSKVKYLRDRHPTLNIEVDGGVGPATIEECAKVFNLCKFVNVIKALIDYRVVCGGGKSQQSTTAKELDKVENF